MRKVEIFITTKFHGRLAEGSGAYGIVLRLEGRPETAKVHVAGWRGLSYQKLNVRAVVEAVQCVTAPVPVKIYLDNAYAAAMMEKGSAGGNAHRELWDTYYEAAARLETVTIERVKDHPYREKLLQKINAGGYPVVEERKGYHV